MRMSSQTDSMDESEVNQLLNQHRVKAFLKNAWNKDVQEELLSEGLLAQSLVSNESRVLILHRSMNELSRRCEILGLLLN